MNSSNYNTSHPTLLGGYNFGFDENSSQLTGNHFKSPILVSAIVVNGICTVSFATLAIMACCMKGPKERGRKVFTILYGLLVAMFLAYARTLADEILHEFNLGFLNAYLALPILKQVLANGTDTTLLFVVYSVIGNRLCSIKMDPERYKRVQYSHLSIFVLMIIFGVADACLYSYAQVYTTANDSDDPAAINITNWYRNIHLSYIVIYSAVVIEMFIWSILILKQSHPKRGSISVWLMTIITPFLVVRSLANFAFTIIYVYLAYEEQKSTGVIVAVLLGLTSVFIYAGLVHIGFEKEWYLEDSRVSGFDVDRIADRIADGITSVTNQLERQRSS